MKNKIWIGVIPGIFGYGISVVGDTNKSVMENLKKRWETLTKASSFLSNSTFKEDFDNFGGYIEEINLGVKRSDNFDE